MKSLLNILLFFTGVALATAATSTGYFEQTVTVSTPNHSFLFAIDWSCDDYPVSSAPGRMELRDSGGTLVARISASVYRSSGISTSITGGGSVTDTSFWMFRYAADGSPADGSMQGTWNVTGLTPGQYTVRMFGYTNWDSGRRATTVWTNAGVLADYPTPGGNTAPTIQWIAAPAGAGNGQAYTVTARGHDDDGNLAQVNVWKDGQPFEFGGGGNGTDGDSGNATSDSGPRTVTFTAQAVDTDGATSSTITHVITIDAPMNTPPTVTLLAPGGQTVAAGTTLSITAQATDSDGNISGHNLDIQRPAGDWNWQGGFATGEPFQGGPVGSGADSARSASFTFTDVGTYYVRSAAYDGSGWYASGTVAITVVAPTPTQFSLATSAGSGGSVSPGGSFAAGSTATVVATPDAYHDFAGWSGDVEGAVNPAGVAMDRNKAVQANFTWKQFALTTSATSGGSVTPGGNYPYGSVVALTAVADALSRFTGWSGGASGSATTTAVTVNGPLTVQAVFAPKNGQAILFNNPGNRPAGAPPFPLNGTSSAGLPVTFTVLSGPATYASGQLQITGPGPITVRASQAGDAYYLPAPDVTQTFNAVAPVVVRFSGAARTVLQARAGENPVNLVLQNP